MACYLLSEDLMLCRGAIYLSTDYSFASLCIMYVWLNLLRRVLRLKWLHALMFPLLNTASRPLSTCFRSNYFDFVFPCIRFRFPDRALPFPYPFPHKNMKTKVVRVFSRSFPTAFIPRYVIPVWGQGWDKIVPRERGRGLERGHFNLSGSRTFCRSPAGMPPLPSLVVLLL